MRAAALLALAVAVRPVWSQAIAPGQLQVVVTQGGVSGNNVHLPGDKIGKTIAVRVLDERDIPQVGATLVFEAQPGVPGNAATATAQSGSKKKKAPKAPPVGAKPKTPASVYFGSREVTRVSDLISDVDGNVTVNKVFGNNVKGPSSILVTATLENKTGTATIAQQNDNGPICPTKCKVLVAAVVTVGGVVAYEVTKPGPTTVTVNSPTASAGK